MKAHPAPRKLLAWTAAALLVLASACSSDSPSEPSREPSGGGGGGGGSVTYNVSVSLSPASAPAGSDDPVIVTVRARRADNNAAAPDGTLAVVSAPSGAFGNQAGSDSATVELTSGQVQVAYFPPAEGTSVVITANVASNIGRATLQLDEPDVFLVSGVEPNFGSPQGGDTVTVRGAAFERPVRVTFGGAAAEVLSTTDNRIRVRTPASSAGPGTRATVAVSVTINVNEAEQTTDSLPGAFTYTPGGEQPTQPVILSVTPGTGPNEGGTPVSIIGEGFQSPLQVEFGAEGTFLEAEVTSVSSGRIEAVTPAATGFGDALRNSSVSIRVRHLSSGETAVLANAFRYGSEVRITSLSPTQGPYFGGTITTTFGQGFDAPVALEAGGEAQDVVSVTGTEIVFRTVPIAPRQCADQTGPVRVVNIETGDGADGPPFTYQVVIYSPLILSINPTTGPQAGGTLVTIRGEDLRDPLVLFGGRPGELVSVASDGSELTVRTPFLPEERLRTEACDDNGDGTQGTRFVSTAVNVTVENRATACTDTFEDGFAYTPTDTSCRNDVGATEPDPECSDGIDNDGDTDIDFPDDAECTDANDDDESA